MDISFEKLELIKWLSQLEDEATIEKIKWLKEHEGSTGDWWDEISEAEKASIQRGLKDADEGRTISHDEVRKRYEQWL